jgi:glycerol-3-phosphate acyltransferase PlsY
MSFLLTCIVFYFIGSFPTAYLLVKYKYGKNLANEGSGNIGARNTLDVTHSKSDGVTVLIIDFLKGLLPVIWFLNYSGFDPEMVIIPSLFIIAGHNYSVWLKFRGGRGLATGAGIMAAVNFILVIIWLIFYFPAQKITKNVHLACVAALILLPMPVILMQEFLLKFLNPALKEAGADYRFMFSFTASLCIIILLKHIEPLIEYFQNKKTNKT